MKTFTRISAFAGLLILLAPALVNAQPKQSSGSPPGVSFTIRFKDGKTSFNQGEVITIEMLFSSSVPNVYSLYGGTYDRGGRFETDAFHVEPSSGIADPTAEYFHSALLGYGGGGLSPGPITLSEKPYVIPRDINELVRFDQPGHYRLYVTNSRVGKLGPTGMRVVESFSMTSNTIAFEVLPPDQKWQEQTIREAAQEVKEKGSDARSGCRTLRFMNSAAAETEMIRLWPLGCAGDFNLGFVGSPRRTAVIDAMETQIAAPDYPVTSSFIHTLSALAFMNENPQPAPFEPTNDPEKIKVYQALAQKRRETFDGIVARYTRQMAATVLRKTKAARAATLDTLLQFEANTRAQKPNAPDNTLDQLIASFPDLFLELPADRQSTLLSSFWYRIGSPAMLPALRQLVAKPPTTTNRFEDLRSVALRRLYQLAPQEGRDIILREMKMTPRRVNMSVLEMLPDSELAEVDQMVAAELDQSGPEREFEVVADNADLIRRYASANVLSRVKKAAADKIGKMSCAPQQSLLSYFLRVDPDFGSAAFEHALGARGKQETGCYRMAFEDVGRKFVSPELEDIALAHIDDPDRSVATQAMILLRQKGSVKAQQPLLDRLARWHTEWKTRPAEVQPQIENTIMTGEPAQFEIELVRALVNATAWTFDADKLKEIDQLVFTPNAHHEIESAIKALDDHTIHITMTGDDDSFPTIYFGTYRAESIDQLKQKLAGLPRGSHLLWQSFTPDIEGDARRFREFKTFLAERGMTLERSEK